MLPIVLVYEFQLLQRGTPCYFNNQLILQIKPMGHDCFTIRTTDFFYGVYHDRSIEMRVN